jgi:hypothetical protein
MARCAGTTVAGLARQRSNEGYRTQKTASHIGTVQLYVRCRRRQVPTTDELPDPRVGCTNALLVSV